jgi:hypothetical protein
LAVSPHAHGAHSRKGARGAAPGCEGAATACKPAGAQAAQNTAEHKRAMSHGTQVVT